MLKMKLILRKVYHLDTIDGKKKTHVYVCEEIF